MYNEEEVEDKAIVYDEPSEEARPTEHADDSSEQYPRSVRRAKKKDKNKKSKEKKERVKEKKEKPKKEKKQKPRREPRRLLRRMFGAVGRGFSGLFAAIAGFFTKAGEHSNMILSIITIISAILSFACAMFSFIFPCNNQMMYEYNYELWLAFTIAAGALAFITVLCAIVYSRKNKVSSEYWLVSIICIAVIVAFALLGLLVGGFNHTMFGWGIAVICVGGVAAVVSLFFLLESVKVPVFFLPLAVCSIVVALCGVTYFVTEQPINYIKSDNGIYYIVREDNTLTVYASDYDTEELVIPSEIDGYRVTAVARPKVTSKSGKLKKVTIPDSVLFIEADAFNGCTGLEELSLPENVRTVGARAFYGCRSLDHVKLNDELKALGESVFENCISLPFINIPASVETIPSKAFKGCARLEAIIIDPVVIDSEAFCNCSALTLVNLSDSVETIGARAFYNSSLLKTIYIPATVKTISANAFAECISLTVFSAHSGATAGMNETCFGDCKVVWGLTFDEYLQAAAGLHAGIGNGEHESE